MNLKKGYLEELASELDSSNFEVIRQIVGERMYNYGDQFAARKITSRLKVTLRKLVRVILLLFWICKPESKNNTSHRKNGVILNGLSSLSEVFNSEGYEIYGLPWSTKFRALPICDLNSRLVLFRLYCYIEFAPVQSLTKTAVMDLIQKSRSILNRALVHANIRAIVQLHDLMPYEVLLTQAAANTKTKRCVYLHGIPQFYNALDDRRGDILFVWGEKLKTIAESLFPSKAKVIVSGYHKRILKDSAANNLRHSLANILINPKSIGGSQMSDGTRPQDRGSIVQYCLIVKRVLIQLGIKNARVRLHPSISGNWLMKFLGDDFFQLDNQALDDSLKQSTLVIGCSSTLLFDSLLSGVNYILFEPLINFETKIDLAGYTLVPPFDGSDPRIIYSFDEIELRNQILNPRQIEMDLIDDYCEEFHPDVVIRAIRD